jgi:hypothetical protein
VTIAATHRTDKPITSTRAQKGTHMKRHSKLLAAVGSVVAIGLFGGVTAMAAAAGTRHDAIEPVRHATRQFHRVDAAVKAGYAQFTDVNGVTCIDGPAGQGNMGIHYVNGGLVGDGKINAKRPEAVLYEQTSAGLQLTAVEYIVTVAGWKHAQPPSLFGHQFMLITAPNRFGLPDFYALHAWIWKDNPSGRFFPWNPTVQCP